MDELMRTFEKKEEDNADQEPADVTGLLAVYIAEIQTVNQNIEASMVDLLQLRMVYQDQMKLFPISYSSDSPDKISCSSIRHFQIQLPKDGSSAGNWLSVELVIKSPLLVQERDTILARAMLHIHHLIHIKQASCAFLIDTVILSDMSFQDSPLMGEVELKETTGEVFAQLLGQFVFTYGMFGFGESFQLNHHVKRPGHFLHQSMFPRLLPPESRMDTNHILVPLPVIHPSFIPFKQKALLSHQETVSLTQSSSKSQLFLSRMKRLGSLRAEYEQIKGRQKKLAFLQDLVVKNTPNASHLNILVTSRNQRYS